MPAEDKIELGFTQEGPLYAMPVLGWRLWRTNKHGDLTAYSAEVKWSAAENVASCKRFSHAAPSSNCHCGFNCFHTFEDAVEYARTMNTKNYIIGAVALSGAVEIHADGVRAEKAVILGLCDLADQPQAKSAASYEKLVAASRQYDVPVMSVAELQQQAQSVAAVANVEDRPVFERRQQRWSLSANTMMSINIVAVMAPNAVFLVADNFLSPLHSFLLCAAACLLSWVSYLIVSKYVSHFLRERMQRAKFITAVTITFIFALSAFSFSFDSTSDKPQNPSKGSVSTVSDKT